MSARIYLWCRYSLGRWRSTVNNLVYTVQYTVYSVKYSMLYIVVYNIQCTVQWSVHRIQDKLLKVQCTVFRVIN